jgi:hypothetical protein
MSPEALSKEFGLPPVKALEAAMELSQKLDVFVNDFAARGTPSPELREKVKLGKTIDNEVARGILGLLTQFKDTPLAQWHNMVELGDKMKRMGGTNGEIMSVIGAHAAAYSVMGISSWFAFDGMLSIITQKQSELEKYLTADTDRERASIMMNALDRTSVVPFMFQLINEQFVSPYESTAADFFSSPTAGTVIDSLKLIQGNMPIEKYIRNNAPRNALPIRAINNWSKKFGDFDNPLADKNLWGDG